MIAPGEIRYASRDIAYSIQRAAREGARSTMIVTQKIGERRGAGFHRAAQTLASRLLSAETQLPAMRLALGETRNSRGGLKQQPGNIRNGNLCTPPVRASESTVYYQQEYPFQDI